MLSVALQGVMTQQLLPTADGSSRVVACEVLVPTPAVRNLIREGKTHQVYSTMQTGAGFGMQTMDSALAELVRKGKISRELALARAGNADELARLPASPSRSGGPCPRGRGSGPPASRQGSRTRRPDPVRPTSGGAAASRRPAGWWTAAPAPAAAVRAGTRR